MPFSGGGMAVSLIATARDPGRVACHILPETLSRIKEFRIGIFETMPGQELAEYLAYILASAHRSMRMGLSESIDDFGTHRGALAHSACAF